MHQPSLCRNGPDRTEEGGADKGLGALRRLPPGPRKGKTEHPLRRRRRRANKAACLSASADPLAVRPAPADRSGPRPALAPWQRQAEAWLPKARPCRLSRAGLGCPACASSSPASPSHSPPSCRADPGPLLALTTPDRGQLLQRARKGRIKSPIHLLLQM